MNTNHWERLSWKTAYLIILANNTKWVSNQLKTWAGRGNCHHLMFISELLLVWSVGRMNPHISDCATKPIQVPWNGNPTTRLYHHSYYSLLCDKVIEKWGEIFEELAKEEGSFGNKLDVSMFFSQHLNWKLLAFLPEFSRFDLERFIQRNNKNKIIKAFKNLKQSINFSKDVLSVNFSVG